MPVEVQLKLKDLAKIALGAPELTNVNIEVLHSLIDILLKKLNCQDEKVELSAFETQHLNKILEHSKISSLAFNDENVEPIADKLNRLECLKSDINKLDIKLENHLTAFHRMNNFNETKMDWDNWETFGTEDLCTICDFDNDIACKLLKNTDFLKKLLRRISAPMVERVFMLEEKLKKLNKDFEDFLKSAEEEYLKIKLLETCIYEIELLRKKVNENQTQFICTMEEVQDMLDAKLDKIHMPAFKKYIKDHFLEIEDSIKQLQVKKECPRAAGIIMEGVRCMSCGSDKVCSDVGAQSMAMMGDATAKPIKLPKKCGQKCGYGKGMSKVNPIRLGENMNLSMRKESIREKSMPKCGNEGDDLNLFEGFDGNLYRKG